MCRLVFFLFISISIYGQQNLLEIKIDSIKTDDSNPKERQFTINYHIENLSNNSILIYLQSNKIIPNAVASMSLKTVYKIYRNKDFIDLDGIFENYQDPLEEKNKSLNDPEYYNKLITKSGFTKSKLDSVFKKYNGNKEIITDDFDLPNASKLKDLIILFNPKEIKNFSVKCSWNKKRYSKNGDDEYYLEDKSDYFIEFVLVLSIEKLKNRLKTSDFENLKKDKNFVSGVFTSNKIKIDFGN